MSARNLSAPRRVGDLLAAAVPGLAERLLGARIAAEWSRIAGEELARGARPGELRAGVLEVRADNSPWLQEVAIRQADLLARLQARYGSRVAALRPVLGSPPVEAARPAPGPAGPHPVRLHPDTARGVDRLTAQVGDPEVRQALRRLLTRDRLARGGTVPETEA